VATRSAAIAENANRNIPSYNYTVVIQEVQ